MGVYEPWRTRRYNEILVESVGALPFDSLEVVDFFGIVCPRGEYTN